MKYIIDGHNLIGKMPDISLQQMDDEQELIKRLKRFCLESGKHRIEVYFDGAPPGSTNSMRDGPVTAYFVRSGSTADAAIEARLARLGKSAREWSVVSSDRRVLTAAKAAYMNTISSEQFAADISGKDSHKPNEAPDPEITPEEVDEWLKKFGRQ
jgi:predicted RNA-binding protein with PIN domain